MGSWTCLYPHYGYSVDVPQGNELYRNLGDGQFEDVTAKLWV